jgi:hypothetical protein
MAAKFAVMNDQSGDEQEVTLKEWEAMQGQGYRITDAAAYDNAMAAAPEPKAEAPKAETPKAEAPKAEPRAAESRSAEPVRGDKPKS